MEIDDIPDLPFGFRLLKDDEKFIKGDVFFCSKENNKWTEISNVLFFKEGDEFTCAYAKSKNPAYLFAGRRKDLVFEEPFNYLKALDE